VGQDIYILTFINNKEMKEIKQEVATLNAAQSGMGKTTTEFINRSAQSIEDAFEARYTSVDDIYNTALEIIRELKISFNTPHMEYLLNYIYRKTGEILVYFNCDIWLLENYIAYERSNAYDFVVDRVFDANYPAEAIKEEHGLDIENMILEYEF
jgi:hypothetical protein